MRFERRIVESMKALRLEDLQNKLGRLLLKDQIEALIARRDALVDYIEKGVAEKREGLVVF